MSVVTSLKGEMLSDGFSCHMPSGQSDNESLALQESPVSFSVIGSSLVHDWEGRFGDEWAIYLQLWALDRKLYHATYYQLNLAAPSTLGSVNGIQSLARRSLNILQAAAGWNLDPPKHKASPHLSCKPLRGPNTRDIQSLKQEPLYTPPNYWNHMNNSTTSNQGNTSVTRNTTYSKNFKKTQPANPTSAPVLDEAGHLGRGSLAKKRFRI